jgi:hypothetical protein
MTRLWNGGTGTTPEYGWSMVDGERTGRVCLFPGRLASRLCSYIDSSNRLYCSVNPIYSSSASTSNGCLAQSILYSVHSIQVPLPIRTAPRTNCGTDMENPNPGWGSARRDRMGPVIELTLLALLACLRTLPYSTLYPTGRRQLLSTTYPYALLFYTSPPYIS